MTQQQISEDFLENVIKLLESEGFVVRTKPMGLNYISISIERDNVVTVTKVAGEDSPAHIAIRIMHTIGWWAIELSNRCANESSKYGNFFDYKEHCEDLIALKDEMDRTSKRLNILYKQWWYKSKQLAEQNNED